MLTENFPFQQPQSEEPHDNSNSNFTLAPTPSFRRSLSTRLLVQPTWAHFQLYSVLLLLELFCPPELPSLEACTSADLASCFPF